MDFKPSKKEISILIKWYKQSCRSLPWRAEKNPYKIWISETMLQQTTSTAVIPFFERFVKKYPTLKSLAHADQEGVYEVWAGLGYYSRARNLLKAAKAMYFNIGQFPQTSAELILLPGIGPYTSRAVSSIAFGEPVGVLDGNVIRFLCRYYNYKAQWWKTKERNQLQTMADQWSNHNLPHITNQALMEMGATVCTPQSPKCDICPLSHHCLGLKAKTHLQLPLKKPKKAPEIWCWNATIKKNKDKILFKSNDYAPFLKKQLLPPGTAKKVQEPPKKFLFKHHITHHQIYVTLTLERPTLQEVQKNDHNTRWVSTHEISQKIPFSLVKKLIDHLYDNNNS